MKIGGQLFRHHSGAWLIQVILSLNAVSTAESKAGFSHDPWEGWREEPGVEDSRRAVRCAMRSHHSSVTRHPHCSKVDQSFGVSGKLVPH